MRIQKQKTARIRSLKMEHKTSNRAHLKPTFTQFISKQIVDIYGRWHVPLSLETTCLNEDPSTFRGGRAQ